MPVLPIASTHYTVTLSTMRALLLLLMSVGWPAVTVAAAAPANFPEVVQTTTEDTCFAAARDLVPDPSTCDVSIQRADMSPQLLASTHNNRGLILGTMGQQAEALDDFDAALELAPGLVAAMINRANALFRLGRYPEALTAYDEALASATSERHIALFNRALVQRALGNVKQASADLAAARRLDLSRASSFLR